MSYVTDYRRRYPERCEPVFLGQCGCSHWSDDHDPETGHCRLCRCSAFMGA